MSRTLFIIGTGGFAKEVAQLASEINSAGPPRWTSIQYIGQRPEDVGSPMPFGELTGTDALLKELRHEADVAIGIGTPAVRRRIAAELALLPLLRAPNLIHPQAGVDVRHVQLGIGNVITRGTVFTCDIRVGDFNVFNLNATVGHDCNIGSFNVVNPGCNISGGVTMGDACLLGTGCQVLEGLSMVSDVTAGGGALVGKNITVAGVYVGVPARLMQ